MYPKGAKNGELFTLSAYLSSFQLFFCFQILRPYDVLVPSGQKKKDYTYPKGTTAVLDTKVFQIDTVVTPIVEAMDVQIHA